MHHDLKQSTRLSLQCLRYFKRHPVFILLSFIAKLTYLLLVISFALPLLDALLNHRKSDFITFLNSHHIHLKSPWFYFISIALLYLANLISTCCFTLITTTTTHDICTQKFTLKRNLVLILRALPGIMYWCVLRSLLGTPLKLLVIIFRSFNCSKKWLLDNYWPITTYFSLILIVKKSHRPFAAIKASGDIIRAQAGNHVYMRINWILSIPMLCLMLLSLWPSYYAFMHAPHLLHSMVILSSVLLSILLSIEECVGHIMMGALFAYLAEKTIQPPFDEAAMKRAFCPRYVMK